MSLWVVVGGQYGSEGKGKISAFITLQEEIDICIRCGGPNSGHSFVAPDGTTKVLRQLPTGYIRRETRLLIPAGALIDLQVLRSELKAFDLGANRVGIDRNAMVIEESDRENEARLKLRERLSSTLCGVGSAVARRALRGADVRLARDAAEQHPWLKGLLTDVSGEANEALDRGRKVLVEGTQGFGLSLYHSPHYPKTTSRDTTAAGFLSEVGLSPLRVTEIVVVFRTFPIRVAGNQAGKLVDELDWETVRRESGYPHPINEFTTVTQKLRRIGRFEWDSAASAIRANQPTRLAVNCLDYLDFANREVVEAGSLSQKAKNFLTHLQHSFHVPISYVGKGPRLDDVLDQSESARSTALGRMSAIAG
ncbi:MAG TPA: adenylosuccinate synthetase [Terriglobales bacterium]|nr:adenylosuccinate synthetase [Terriglobales bacterium]